MQAFCNFRNIALYPLVAVPNKKNTEEKAKTRNNIVGQTLIPPNTIGWSFLVIAYAAIGQVPIIAAAKTNTVMQTRTTTEPPRIARAE
jgi:hypothetical protein